jgi:hypothetical protein
MLKGSANVLAVLQRYASAAERSYYKAHRELCANRKERAQAEARAAKTEAKQLDNMIKNYIFAPVPLPSRKPANTELRNEANLQPPAPTTKHSPGQAPGLPKSVEQAKGA